MRVKAKMLGFYDNLRRPEGTVFTLKDKKHFSKIWMEQVSGKKHEAEPVVDKTDGTDGPVLPEGESVI